MKNPIEKNKILEGKVRLGAALLTLTMLGGTPQLPINPLAEKAYAIENTDVNTTNTVNYTEKDLAAMKLLMEYLNYLCSFATQKGGHITYIKGSSTEGRNRGKLEEGFSDCSWFIFRGMEHEGLLKDKKDFVRSAAWGNNGYINGIDVASFEKGEPWDYSNASPRRCYLGGI